MSKSMKRVKSALAEAGLQCDIVEMPDLTRTAQQAAEAAGCQLDQIAKSVIFEGKSSGAAILFLTAGGNQVDAAKASAVAATGGPSLAPIPSPLEYTGTERQCSASGAGLPENVGFV